MMMMTDRQTYKCQSHAADDDDRHTSASLMMVMMTDRQTYKCQSHDDDDDDDVSETYKCQSHDDNDDRQTDTQVPVS